MPGLSRWQYVIYYSCELQYILYISTRVYVSSTGSFTASMSQAKWRQLFCRLHATMACFSSPSGPWENATVLISSCLLPFVCPRCSIHAAWRVLSYEQCRSSGGAGTLTGVDGQERGEAKDAAWGETDRCMQVLIWSTYKALPDMLPRQPQYFKTRLASKLLLKFMMQTNVPL